MKQYNKPRKA